MLTITPPMLLTNIRRNSVTICFFSSLITGLLIFVMCTSTLLFTGSTFYENLKNIHEYLIQHSLKSGGTKDHFKRVLRYGLFE